MTAQLKENHLYAVNYADSPPRATKKKPPMRSYIPATLHAEFKQVAADHGTTMTTIMLNIINDFIQDTAAVDAHGIHRIKTASENGILPMSKKTLMNFRIDPRTERLFAQACASIKTTPKEHIPVLISAWLDQFFKHIRRHITPRFIHTKVGDLALKMHTSGLCSVWKKITDGQPFDELNPTGTWTLLSGEYDNPLVRPMDNDGVVYNSVALSRDPAINVYKFS